MTFQIPEDLSKFSAHGIQDLLNQANAEYDAVFTAADPDTISDDEIDYMERLQQFRRVDAPAALKAAKAEAANQRSRTDRFAALNTEPATETTEEPAEELETVTASSKVTVGEIVTARNTTTGTRELVPAAQQQRFSSLVAAAGVPNYNAGEELPTMLDIAKAFEARSSSHGRLRGTATVIEMQPVAQLVRDYPAEFSVNGDETDYQKLLALTDESRLPGGNLLRAVEKRRADLEAEGKSGDSLVAAAGWCAPSETDYSICLQISTDGMFDAPEVQARRGGIRHNTGIQFNSIFGGGSCSSPTGFFDLTEAQVASGTIKTCLEIPCPSFVDTRLGVTGLCLTGNILSIRGYPEFTATFTRGALAAHMHQVNREQIADVVSGSTAVNLTAFAPWATDGSTVSQILSAVEMAIVDIKYAMRMERSATLEVVFPWWILAQMRADWIRRNGGNYADMLTLADSAISSAFSARGARVQFVYDWQDAFATCAATGAVGAATPINNLPSSVQFLVYPAGTWVRAVSDVITLNSVYDSTKLATNQVTHLFTETGWAMLQMCPISRVYTVPICPSGKTTNQGTLTCP